MNGDPRLIEYLQDRIRHEGRITFKEYMAEVLYHPEFGYYSRGEGRIGARGDFYTSSDVDPLFGQLLARQFQEMAEGYDSFTLVELGAGKGLLARHILEQRGFRYSIVERSPAMRQMQQDSLKGYSVEWLDELPAGITGCIFSNEFFDALPVHRLVCRGGVLKEIYVGPDFTEIEDDPEVRFALSLNNLGLKNGQIVDLNLEALGWIQRIAASIGRGYHLAIDYGYLADEFYSWPRGTLMCYWRHQAVENPYARIGEQDITAHVNFSDLIDAGRDAGLEPAGFTKQMNFLISLGLLEEIQKLAEKSDPVSIRRLLAVKNLILPGMMGERFKVLIQRKGLSSRPLRGFQNAIHP